MADVSNNTTDIPDIKADESAIDSQIKFSIGTKSYSKTINNVLHASEAATIGSLENKDQGDNANVNFKVGDKEFSKTVNNVQTATNATNVTITEDTTVANNVVKFEIGTGSYNKTIKTFGSKDATFSVSDGQVDLDYSTYSGKKVRVWLSQSTGSIQRKFTNITYEFGIITMPKANILTVTDTTYAPSCVTKSPNYDNMVIITELKIVSNYISSSIGYTLTVYLTQSIISDDTGTSTDNMTLGTLHLQIVE